MLKKTLGFKLVVGGILIVSLPLLIVGLFSVTMSSEAMKKLSEEVLEEEAAITRGSPVICRATTDAMASGARAGSRMRNPSADTDTVSG